MPHEAPILETNGGFGRIFERAYYDRPNGVVLEKDERKAEHLAAQRPTWRVYCGESVQALEAGIAGDVAFAFIDLDPYGSPFDLLEAIFRPGRVLADRVELVVNDGMRNKTRMRGEWHVKALRPIVESIVARSGFKVTGWRGWYAGENDDLTHYWATLERGKP